MTAIAPAAIRAPGLVLGLGLGGFVDGIVLHQILGWHHLVSSVDRYPASTLEGLRDNVLADGLFHAATWVLVVLGLVMLWRTTAERRLAAGGRALAGWLLIGWGAFNLVDGVLSHFVLGIHHVREGANGTAWDGGFLVLGVALVLAGWALARSEPHREAVSLPDGPSPEAPRSPRAPARD